MEEYESMKEYPSGGPYMAKIILPSASYQYPWPFHIVLIASI